MIGAHLFSDKITAHSDIESLEESFLVSSTLLYLHHHRLCCRDMLERNIDMNNWWCSWQSVHKPYASLEPFQVCLVFNKSLARQGWPTTVRLACKFDIPRQSHANCVDAWLSSHSNFWKKGCHVNFEEVCCPNWEKQRLSSIQEVNDLVDFVWGRAQKGTSE